MPLPCRQVLLNYLDEYRKLRSVHWGQPLQVLVTAGQTVMSYLTGTKVTVRSIQEEFSDIRDRISQSITFKDWLKTIQILAERAKYAATELKTIKKDIHLGHIKIWQAEASYFAETLHALRNIIVLELKTVRFGNSEDENIANLFATHVQNLNQQIRHLKADIQRDLNNGGKQSPDKVNEINALLIELAYLEDVEAIFDCTQERKIITHLEILPARSVPPYYETEYAYNRALPFCLQPQFAKLWYAKKLQPLTRISFREFVENAQAQEFKDIARKLQTETSPSGTSPAIVHAEPAPSAPAALQPKQPAAASPQLFKPNQPPVPAPAVATSFSPTDMSLFAAHKHTSEPFHEDDAKQDSQLGQNLIY